MPKTRWSKTGKPQIPRDPCAHCGKPVDLYGWVINGAGDLLHYPSCFDAFKGASKGGV
jgi:hypothetical protein